MPMPLREHTAEGHLASVWCETQHVRALISLPFHHRDPFDRMLVAQAATENARRVSADAEFDAHGIDRIW